MISYLLTLFTPSLKYVITNYYSPSYSSSFIFTTSFFNYLLTKPSTTLKPKYILSPTSSVTTKLLYSLVNLLHFTPLTLSPHHRYMILLIHILLLINTLYSPLYTYFSPCRFSFADSLPSTLYIILQIHPPSPYLVKYIINLKQLGEFT